MSKSDEVRNFINQDKALCAQALSNGRDVLLRAAEMIDGAMKKAASAEADDRQE